MMKLVILCTLFQCCHGSFGTLSFDTLMASINKDYTTVSSIHQSIQSFLVNKNVPIGISSRHQMSKNATDKTLGSLIIVSTKSKPIDCRVSLEKVPPGLKCISPCKCTG